MNFSPQDASLYGSIPDAKLTPQDESKQLYYSFLNSLHQTYLVREGAAKRGAHFAKVALALDQKRFRLNTAATQQEVLSYFGPPDYYLSGGSHITNYAFLYDRYGNKDWMVVVSLKNESAFQITWSPTPADKLSSWTPFSPMAPAAST